jgi:PPOX class probable F420-dependent enzyme
VSDPSPSRRLRGSEVLDDPLVRELLDARLVGVLATFDRGGTIHAVPMWFAKEEGSIAFATSSTSRKVRNVELDTRATLVVHDSRPGYEVCGAQVTGAAEVVRGDEARSIVDRVHRRYLEAAGADDPAVRAFLDSDDVALRLRPVSALTWDERESEASRVVRSAGWALPLVTTEPRPYP